MGIHRLMSKLFRGLRKLRGLVLRQGGGVQPGFVDFSLYSEEVGRQRGRGARIGEKVRLIGKVDAVNPQLVTIGDYAVIGYQSGLLTHCPIRGAKPCTIGSFVYVGFGAIVMPGVSVGDGAFIGAGSVVTRDVPPSMIVAGNPARSLRMLTDTEQQSLRRILLEERIFDGSQPVIKHG